MEKTTSNYVGADMIDVAKHADIHVLLGDALLESDKGVLRWEKQPHVTFFKGYTYNGDGKRDEFWKFKDWKKGVGTGDIIDFYRGYYQPATPFAEAVRALATLEYKPSSESDAVLHGSQESPSIDYTAEHPFN